DGLAARGAQGLLALGDGLADVGDRARDRRERHEPGLRGGSDDAGEGGLAGAGRPPEDDGAEAVGGDQVAERAVGADEVRLADELVEGPGPHARGEGRERIEALL